MLGKPQPRYRDLFFRIILSLAAAHIIVVFGERHFLAQLLLMPEYYISVAASFCIAMTVISMVRWLTMRLDRHYDWMEQPLKRTGLQLLLVGLAPGAAAFLLAALYFRLQGISILDTVYLRLDFPVILLMLILLNVYYVAYYFYLYATHSAKNTERVQDEEDNSKEIFVVSRGAKNIPVAVDDINYFFRAHDVNYIRTSENNDYMINQSLDDVQELLNPQQFFRINRQMIVNFKACQHFESLPFGKLQLFVQPEPKEAVIISQKRAKQFKEWMER